jgi:two-component system chemotaxis response regulator CheY
MFDKNITILVADDMLTMRKLVGKALKEMGFKNLVEAADGQKAWDELVKPQHKFSLIVSDWNMPNFSGLDLLKKVRADEKYKSMPFILLTAETEQSQVIEAIQAGVDNYVTKPFTKDTLEQKIVAVYKKRMPKAA